MPYQWRAVNARATPRVYAGFKDYHVRKFETRSGKEHQVVVAGKRYDLRGNGSNGWVVAPEAKEHDVCFAGYEMVYGGPKHVVPRWSALEPHDGVLVLNKKYDAFTDSPKTQEVKAGETVRRWSLRTVSCDALEEEMNGTKKDPQLGPGEDD